MSLRSRMFLMLSVAFLSTGCAASDEEIAAGSETAGSVIQKREAARTQRLEALKQTNMDNMIIGFMRSLKSTRMTSVTTSHVLWIPGSSPRKSVRATKPVRTPSHDASVPFARNPQARLNNGTRPKGWRSHSEHGSGYNCHGFTFLGGAGLLDGAAVQAIVGSGPYQAVNESSAQVGDVVLYYNGSTLEHSGIVVGKGTNGLPRILSKWGIYEMYDHDADVILTSYGTTRRYYRNAANKTHLLEIAMP